MQSKELLRSLLGHNKNMTMALIEDLKDQPLATPTTNGGNHATWIAGHITYNFGALMHELMQAEPNPFEEWKELFNTYTEPTADAEHYPAFDQVVAKCKAAHQECVALLDSMSEEDLDQESKGCPPEFKDFAGTYRLCFLSAANHWMFHYGQLADIRRTLKRKPLMA